VLVLDAVRPRFGPAVTLNVQGPERIALVGPNGAGFAPHALPNAVRANLARMLFPGAEPISWSRRCPVASCSAPPAPRCCSPSPQ